MLTPALERTVFRIQQEALTNVLKHAPGAAARAVLAYGPDELVVEVTNGRGDRTGAPNSEPGAGYGLAGMRERVTLLGGRMEAGPAAGGGFRVRAVLPLAPAR